MASMMTSSQDGKIRAISDKEWTERRRKELFPEELIPRETPMSKDLAIEVLRSMFSVELIRKYLCDQTLLYALQSQELLSKREMETVQYIHQMDNKVYQLIKILSSKCRDRTVLERFYCALHNVFERKSKACDSRITGSYRHIFEMFRHTVWRAYGVSQQIIEEYESSLQLSVPALCERLKQHCRLTGEGRCLRELAAKLKLRNPPPDPDMGAEWICEKVVKKYPEPQEGFNVLAEALLLTRGLDVVACGALPIRHSPMSTRREDSSCLGLPNVHLSSKSKRKSGKRKQCWGDNTDPTMDAVRKDVPLDIARLKPVLSVLWDVRCYWFILGVQLDIDYPTLQAIKESCHHQTDDCFTSMISKYLMRHDPVPTLSHLVNALSSPPVNHSHLADRLMEMVKREFGLNQTWDDTSVSDQREINLDSSTSKKNFAEVGVDKELKKLVQDMKDNMGDINGNHIQYKTELRRQLLWKQLQHNIDIESIVNQAKLASMSFIKLPEQGANDARFHQLDEKMTRQQRQTEGEIHALRREILELRSRESTHGNPAVVHSRGPRRSTSTDDGHMDTSAASSSGSQLRKKTSQHSDSVSHHGKKMSLVRSPSPQLRRNTSLQSTDHADTVTVRCQFYYPFPIVADGSPRPNPAISLTADLQQETHIEQKRVCCQLNSKFEGVCPLGGYISGPASGILANMSREHGVNFRVEIDHQCHIFAKVPTVLGSVINYHDIVESEHSTTFFEILINTRQVIHSDQLCTKQHLIVLISDDIRHTANGQSVTIPIPV